MPSFEEKRPFSRVSFNAPARLRQADQHWYVQVRDVSLKGALLDVPDGLPLDEQERVELQIELNDHIEIDMLCRVAHQEPGRLGLACVSIDLDSIQYLRRLIELNLGDGAAMERELNELVERGSD